MIVYHRREHWLRLLFHTRGSSIPRVLPEMAVAALIGSVAVLLHEGGTELAALWTSAHEPNGVVLDDNAHVLLAAPLSFLLVFRSNQAYTRYWEGRGLVGKMLLSVRELARIIASYHVGDDAACAAERAELRRLSVLLYAVAVHALQADGAALRAFEPAGDGAFGRAGAAEGERGGAAGAPPARQPSSAAAGDGAGQPQPQPPQPQPPAASAAAAAQEELSASEQLVLELATQAELGALSSVTRSVPVCATWLSTGLQRAALRGRLSPEAVRLLDPHVSALVGAWMGANKIRHTPLPYPYVQLLQLLLALFVFTLPLTLPHRFGWLTPLVSAVVALALLGINEVASELEMPFGRDPNDLPLDAFAQVARADATAVLEQRDARAEGEAGRRRAFGAATQMLGVVALGKACRSGPRATSLLTMRGGGAGGAAEASALAPREASSFNAHNRRVAAERPGGVGGRGGGGDDVSPYVAG